MFWRFPHGGNVNPLVTFEIKEETMGVNELSPIMTVAQYAAVMGMSEWTVRKHCRLGIIPGAFKHPGAKEWRIRTAEALGVCA